MSILIEIGKLVAVEIITEVAEKIVETIEED